ncbi:MAM and LDL-receptor class A domain-containing protein 1-like [Denticeps clupeoides]|uniref:MAM and LDL-receptor class A domain-containing protein 1-like n=1 Tax=Denticeps clupeoides TaxID=299321 RepID=UPI0010A5983A|nr:MAM and LDL-receptor class A domain-containing protein 1-like [Denticeps clupeoides]
MKPSFHEKQDVMLDDITFPYCSAGAIPPGSDWLSCDFETGACGWYPDHSASMTWKRVKEPSNFNPGPEFDHTTGEGYYIFIGTDRTTDPSMTARMMSYPQQAKCISFWYHIYGSSIGTLKFKAKEAEGDETDIWMRTGTHGNKWRFVDLTLPAGGPPVQFIFEAVLGGTHGSIAIDDVVVSSGVDGACPPERECTFQASLCGLQPDPTADFSWVRARGGHASGVPGPAADHTLGTAQGYYLSGNLWEHPKGSRGHMVTTVNAPTPQSGECWMFWYHMGGQGVGELSVRLRPEQRSTSSFPLWTISGDQGDLWRHGRATVLSPDSPYQVVFEAVVGDGPGRNIAIDDLLILNGPCPPEGFCDFEMDMCDWLNRPYGPTAVAWDWTSASGQGKFVPDVDHTTNSALGHYMVFDAYSGEQTAHFISVHMAPVSKCCLEFWYHMEMWFENDLVQLSVYINESGTLDLLWSQNGNQKDVWHKMMLDYTSQNRHQIIFEASCPHNVDGVIALDDIFVRRDVACSDLLPTTPAPTTQPTSPPVSAMSCSFEDGFCDWVQDSGSAWSRQNGIHVKGPWLGPLYDHTAENNQGFYLLVNKSGEEKAEPAVISVAVATQADDICVGFWYYMLGASASSLDVLVQSKNSQDVVWTRGGSQESEWLSAQVTISTADKERVRKACVCLTHTHKRRKICR